MKAAAETLKPTFLELGGKSVYLVLEDDGDISATVGGSAFIMMHAGQGCAMPTGLLVPNSRYEEAVEIVKVAMEKNKYGDPTDPSVLQGPQVSKRQQERVLGYIEKGKQEGARLVTGGGVPKHLPKGYSVEPTVFADVDNQMTIAQEEIFGPVLSVIGFDDDDEAVRIANDSIYGLSGVVFANDLDRAKSVASRIRQPARLESTAAPGTAPTHRSVATSSPVSAGSAASRGSRSSPKPRPSAGPRFVAAPAPRQRRRPR